MCGGGGGIGKVIGSIGSAVSGAVKGVVSAVKSVAKSPIFQAIAPIALNMFFPGLGMAASGALGLSAAWAPAIGGALTGGVMGAIGGKGLGGALKGAAIGGIASGVGDYLMTGNNPLSGMFSGQEGGMANNVLSAGGTGSTQLTGVGSGLGVDSSTVGTQFGAVNPTASASASATGGGSSFGGINPNAQPGSVGLSMNYKPTVGGGIRDPISGLTEGGLKHVTGTSGTPGFLDSLRQGNIMDAGKAAVKGISNLMPTSTGGKIALGVGALGVLGGLGGPSQPTAGGAPPPSDPSFTQRLQQQNFNWNPTNQQRNMLTYGQRTGSRSAMSYGIDPATGLPVTQNDPNAFATREGESQFFSPTITPVTPAARGGLIAMAHGGYLDMPYRGMSGMAMGGLAHLADGSLVSGEGTGVSDEVPASIDDRQEARLSSGEFVIPARAVSALGEGSSEAGARILQKMVNRLNSLGRGNGDVARDTNAHELLPA